MIDSADYLPSDTWEDMGESFYCSTCGLELDWVDCWQCGGKGGKDGDDLMEEDPMWYDEDDWEECDICHGRGGWRECPALPHPEPKVEAEP